MAAEYTLDSVSAILLNGGTTKRRLSAGPRLGDQGRRYTMANHPNRSRFYKVEPLHGSSDTEGEAHFAVRGPRINELAVQAALATLMQKALNVGRGKGGRLTESEWDAVYSAVQFVLAGEDPWEADAPIGEDGQPSDDSPRMAALRTAREKLAAR